MDIHKILNEEINSFINENNKEGGYEVFYSDGIVSKEWFKDIEDAFSFAKSLKNKPKMQRIEIFKNDKGFRSTTQEEFLIAWWGEGSYWDNVSQKNKSLLNKKL